MRQSPSPYGFRPSTNQAFNTTPTSEMNHIHGGVWIGSHKALSSATPLLARNIRFVVNTAIEFITETPELINWSDLYNNGVQVHNTYWDDTMTQTIYPSPSIEEAVHKITDVIRSNGCVLVNCAMGKSRSTSLVIAWLMAMNSMTYDQALATCKKSRPQCQPNKNFERQLRALEGSLAGSRHGAHGPPPAPSSLYPTPTNSPFPSSPLQNGPPLPSTPSRPPPITAPLSPSNVGKPYPLTLPSQMNANTNPYASPSHTNGPNGSLPFGSPSRAPYTPSSPYSNTSTPTTPSGMHFPLQHPSSSATASRFERSPSRPNGLSLGQFPMSPSRTGQNSSTVTPLIPPYSPRGQQGQGMNGMNPQYPSALQRSTSPPPQFSSLQSPVSPLSRSSSQHPASPLSAFNRSTSPRIAPQQTSAGTGFTSPLRGQQGPQHTHPFMLRRLSL